jgi:hypothetical protein
MNPTANDTMISNSNTISGVWINNNTSGAKDNSKKLRNVNIKIAIKMNPVEDPDAYYA